MKLLLAIAVLSFVLVSGATGTVVVIISIPRVPLRTDVLLALGLSGYAVEGAGAETKLGFFKAHLHMLRHACGFGLNYVLIAA